MADTQEGHKKPTLVLSRLIPPYNSNRFEKRDRLVQEFNRLIDYKILIIQGPPGSGKTSFLYDCYNSLSEDAFHEMWLTIDGTAVTFENLKYYLLQGLSNIFEKGQLDDLFEEDFATNEEFLLALSNALYRYSSNPKSKDVVIFLDNFDKLDFNKSVDFINDFCSYMPPKFHLVIAENYFTRTLIRADFRNFVYVFANDALNLSKEETALIAQEHAPQLLESSVLDELYDYTKGWFLGTYTYIEAAAHDELPQTEHLDKDVLNSLVHNFFTACLDDLPISNLDSEFLVESSLLLRCNASLCNYMLDRYDAQVVLDKFLKLNLFIEEDPKQVGWYEFNPVFSRWLRNKLMQIRLDSIRQLSYLASEWFEKDGQKYEAVKFLLLSSDFDYIKNLSAPLTVMKESSNIKFYMDICEMNAEQIKTNAFTAMFVMWAYLCAGRREELLEWLNIFMEDYRLAQGQTILFDERHTVFYFDPKMITLIQRYVLVKCEGLRGEYQYLIDQHEQLLQDYKDSLPHALKCIIIYDLAEAYQYAGNFVLAEKYYLESHSLSELAHSKFFAIFSSLGICWTHILSGKYEDAEQMCRDTLQVCPPDFSLYGALNTALAYICIKTGRLDEASTYLKRAKKRLSKTRNIDMYFELKFIEALYLNMIAQQKKAFNLVTKAAVEIKPQSLPRGVNFLGNLIYAQIVFEMGYYDQAKDIAAMIVENACNNPIVRLKGELIFSWIDYKMGKFEKVLEDSQNFIARAIQLDLISSELNGRTLRVMALEELGKSGQAKKELNRLLSLAEQNKEMDVFVYAGDKMHVLLHEVLNTSKSNWSAKNFIRNILRNFGDNQETEAVAEASFDANLTDRENEILELLNLGLSRKEIAQSLNISLNTVKTHIAHIYQKLEVNNRVDAFKKSTLS
ncbi:MAG: LuxR C-terminal-related transcriptional regulator [Coriobacteriia bacterium]|nr:LuxR C-terminal-related transcriptional regulator [Coriobacteriia bacterium]